MTARKYQYLREWYFLIKSNKAYTSNHQKKNLLDAPFTQDKQKSACNVSRILEKITYKP